MVVGLGRLFAKFRMKKVFKYEGFESAYDFERDISELYDEPEFAALPAEFKGTLTVTIEYKPTIEEIREMNKELNDEHI